MNQKYPVNPVKKFLRLAPMVGSGLLPRKQTKRSLQFLPAPEFFRILLL